MNYRPFLLSLKTRIVNLATHWPLWIVRKSQHVTPALDRIDRTQFTLGLVLFPLLLLDDQRAFRSLVCFRQHRLLSLGLRVRKGVFGLAPLPQDSSHTQHGGGKLTVDYGRIHDTEPAPL